MTHFMKTYKCPCDTSWGWDQDRWHYHGNAVIGQMIATDNEYGVTGAAPEAEVLVIAPYPEENYYNVQPLSLLLWIW